jgi:hypothetical protein
MDATRHGRLRSSNGPFPIDCGEGISDIKVVNDSMRAFRIPRAVGRHGRKQNITSFLTTITIHGVVLFDGLDHIQYN